MIKKSTKKKEYRKGEIAGLKKRALKLWHADSIGKNSHAMKLGLALLAVRDALRGQHGEFKKWWQDYRLVQSRVSYCMDRASRKLEKRKKKAKAKSVEDVRSAEAMQAVSKPLSKLFRTCAQGFDDPLSLLSFHEEFVEFIGATFNQVASLAGWKLNRPEYEKAATAYETALHALIASASRPAENLKKTASAGA